MSNIVSFPRCKLLIRPLEILFMVNVLLFTAWRITQYVRLKNKSGCQLFLVIGLFIYVLARGHFSRPHLYPLSATNRIRSAIIELNRTRRKPSVLKVSLFSSLLIVSPSLSVKTNDNLRLDWIPLNFFSLSLNLYFPYSSGKAISPSLYPRTRGPIKKDLYKGDQSTIHQRRVQLSTVYQFLDARMSDKF